jgi:hypothetical protein
VLTVCSQGSSVATNYICIYIIFSCHLVICRHSHRQPVWLIQVKLNAFSQQFLLHELSAARISFGQAHLSSPDFHIHWGLCNYVILLSWSFIPWVNFCCCFYCCYYLFVSCRGKELTFLNLDINFFSYLELFYRLFSIFNESNYLK